MAISSNVGCAVERSLKTIQGFPACYQCNTLNQAHRQSFSMITQHRSLIGSRSNSNSSILPAPSPLAQNPVCFQQLKINMSQFPYYQSVSSGEE